MAKMSDKIELTIFPQNTPITPSERRPLNSLINRVLEKIFADHINNNDGSSSPLQSALDDDVIRLDDPIERPVDTTPARLAQGYVFKRSSDQDIARELDAGREFTFTYASDVYSLRKVDGRYKAFNAEGVEIDNNVQINNTSTVKGFVEVGGVPRLAGGNRLSLGLHPDSGEMLMIKVAGNLDGGHANHVDEL
jgi:hypothetical protein